MSEPLVGRDRERDWLEAFLDGAAAGHGSLVLVAGEAGMGKSSLVRAVLPRTGARAGAQVTVLEGAGAATGVRAFGPLVEALRGYLRSAPGIAGGPLVEGPLAAHLAVALPELGVPAADPDGGAVVEGFRQAFAALAARGPAVLFLDDLHWADDATLELLPALARDAEGAPLLVVGAFRSDDLARGHALRQLRAALRRSGRLQQLTLEPLAPAAVVALLESVVGPVAPAVATLVADRTEGVPFFVKELGTALAASGGLRPGPSGLELPDGADVPLPESVRDAVLLRVADVSEAERAAVLAAAVVGQRFDPELVTAVAQVSEWPDGLVRRGIVIEEASGCLAFPHALVRDAFYAELPWTRRLALHRAVGERLEAARAEPVTVAEHWIAGRRPDRARVSLTAAADAACAVHAYRDAARSLRRALELWPEDGDEQARLATLERLAQCLELAGRLAEATTTWREVLDGHARDGTPGARGAAARRLAGALELQGRWQEALAAREQAATAFTAGGLPADAALERLAAAAHLRSAASFRAALTLTQDAAAQAAAAGRADLRARALALEGNVRARMGEGEAGVELVRTGLALALENGFAGPAAEIYQRLADSLEHAGNYPGAEDTYREAYVFCSANGLDATAQLCLACLTAVLRQSGDWEHAARLCREVMAVPGSSPHARAVAAGMLGSILATQGRATRARPLLLEALTLARGIELAAMEILALWGLALADHDLGADGPAAAHCRSLLQRWRGTEDRHYAVSPLRWAVTFFAESGQVDDARACAAALAELAGRGPDPEGMAALSHALGELALLDGDAEQAAAHFARSLALLESVDVPFDRVETTRRSAAGLVAAGRRDEAVDHLVSAHRAARRLGAAPLARRVAAALEELGEHPDRRRGRQSAPSSAQTGLTRRELEVLRLVAAGRTNREIARELFLSPRTVEMHVSNVLARLDCRSRADAARRAAALGLLASSTPTPR